MITKNKISKGLNNNTITLIVDPYMGQGTVCKIGDYWFYFGGLTAEQMNPEEFKKEIPHEDIVNDIYDVIESFKELEEFEDEYNYYDSILKNI